MPPTDITDLIAQLRYQHREAKAHWAKHDAAVAGWQQRYHREEALVASSACTEIITTLNANMRTGIDPNDWTNRDAQIAAFLGEAIEAEVAA